jgi:coproporphyrinogen III oxidase
VRFQVQKQACDKFDPSFYPKFKKWCDDYFHIKVSLFKCSFGLFFWVIGLYNAKVANMTGQLKNANPYFRVLQCVDCPALSHVFPEKSGR